MKPTLQFQFDDLGALHRFLTKIIPVVDDGTLTQATMQTLKDGAEKYKPEEVPAQAAVPTAPVLPVPTPAPAAPVVPEPAPAPVPTVAPVQQTTLSGAIQAAEPMPTPTVAATYTPDDLARAAVQLVDAGRQPELMPLLQKYGVAALPDLQEAQYAAFAADLRQLGVQV